MDAIKGAAVPQAQRRIYINKQKLSWVECVANTLQQKVMENDMNNITGRHGICTCMLPFLLRTVISVCIAVLALSFYPVQQAKADVSIDQVLPFKRPALSSLQAKPKKACAIWHVWRISVDNAEPEGDFYNTVSLNPLGEGGRYFSMGGPMRERPLPRPKRSDSDWQVRDMELDIRRARDIGLDCFYFSLCTVGAGTNCWGKMIDALKAARNIGGGFRIVPMMDIASMRNQGTTAVVVASELAALAKDNSLNSALMRDKEGRIYIGSTNANLVDPSWWFTLKSQLTKAGVSSSFVLLLQNWGQWETLKPVVDGVGTMGVGTPYFAKDGVADRAASAHGAGKIFAAGIKAQDFRPDHGIFLEAGNFDTFRLSLEDAINNNADWLVFNSWNDRYESTEISPSTGTQWALYDLAAYYITWFKMGVQPVISRDVLYYSHRIMWLDTPYNPTKQPFAMHRAAFQWQQPDLDEIELLGFLKLPGTLSIKTDKGVKTMKAPAGITSFHIPLAPGRPKFSLIRGDVVKVSVNSPFRVRNITTWHDFLYRSGSSTRAAVSMVADPPLSN